MGWDCKPYLRDITEWMYDMYIVIRKNLRVRRRRYIASLLEIIVPICVVIFVAYINIKKPLFRLKSLRRLQTENVSLLDPGEAFGEDDITKFRLCNLPDDRHYDKCFIGYVADATTEDKVFNNSNLQDWYNDKTEFLSFPDEKSIEDCIQHPVSCSQLQNDRENFHLFRGAVVFETSINDLEVRYKIRLLERQIDSLKHVMKTNHLEGPIDDRNQFIKSYLHSGFLAMQRDIDRLILEHVKNVTKNTYIDFKPGSNCTCKMKLHETPHRHSDQLHESPKTFTVEGDNFLLEVPNKGSGLEFFQRSVICTTILVFSFASLIPSEQRRIVTEKENGLKILLLVTGMTHRMQWFGNLIDVAITYSIAVTVMVAILKYPFATEGAVFEMVAFPVLWIFLMLYVMALASCCYLFSVFFERPVLAILVSMSAWIVTFLTFPGMSLSLIYLARGTQENFPLTHIDVYYEYMAFPHKIIMCFHPSIALQMVLKIFVGFERDGVKTNLLTLANKIPFDSMRLIYIIIIFIVQICLYMVTTVYLDCVLKSRFGVNKPWYYFFRTSEWHDTKNKVGNKGSTTTKSEPVPGFEPYREDVEPSLETFNLTKKYGNIVAVDNLSIKLYHGEIFALLGQNGSGKSSTLDLFAGFTAPTSGTANICGYDIATNMVKIQAFTGFCPQANHVYEDLTVKEHVLIFGRLRGLRGSEAEDECSDLLEKLRLFEMRNLTARKLSKGDLRKLCLAIALIGNPKVVILDEPTCGMDYYSRRAVWDILLKIRSNHTIIFSTHFMDEAELLGDKIGILASGRLQTYGSHAFLRRHFGFGYSLKMKMNPNITADLQKIIELVRGSMPNASLSTLPVHPHKDRVFSINLPEGDYSSNSMSSLFSALTKFKESLGIQGFGVSTATLDEVFLALSLKLNPAALDIVSNTNQDDSEEQEQAIPQQERKQSFILPFIQFYVLFKKKFWFTIAKRNLFIFQVLVPVVLFTIAIARLRWSTEADGRDGPLLKITLDSYAKPISIFHESDEYGESLLKSVLGSKTARRGSGSDLKEDFAVLNKDYNYVRTHYIIGLATNTGSAKEVLVYFSVAFFHTAPLAVNIFANTLLKKMDINRELIVTNHPFQHPYYSGPEYHHDPYAPEIYAILATIGVSILVACCLVFPLEERLNQVKHLQLMTGVNAGVYWLAVFACDFIIILIVYITTYFVRSITSTPSVLVHEKEWTSIGVMAILVCFTYSGLMMSYTFSHFANSVSGGFALYIEITILFGLLLPFFNATSMPTGLNQFSRYLFRLVPIFSMSSAMRKYAYALRLNAKCTHFTELGKEFYCGESKVLELSAKRSCCSNCLSLAGSSDCVDRRGLLRGFWEEGHNKGGFVNGDDNTRDPSATYEILTLLFVGMTFNFLAVFLDSDKWKFVEAMVFGLFGKAFQTDVHDEDVIDEMDRVDELVKSKKFNAEALIAKNLSKTYGIFPAVHDVSFGVHHGEAFGILGVNGAGKSTLFQLLTSTKTQTFGNVYTGDYSLTKGHSRLMRKMGYSSHTGASIMSYMTPEATLHLFSRLRGLSMKETKEQTKELLKSMSLENFAKVRCQNLSVGTRRRLTALMATIGSPPIVLIDEPTSSADPVTRRLYWELLKNVKKNGQTLIFNSHRIHDCEALCHRIGILIDGKFQCIGSPSHLKDKFGKGFKLLIKLVPGPADNQGYVSSLSDTVVEVFSPCSLRDRRRNVIQYVIHDYSICWDYLYLRMEHIKLRYNDLVEDYSFSETTLEEVFLSFVLFQNCGRVPDVEGCC